MITLMAKASNLLNYENSADADAIRRRRRIRRAGLIVLSCVIAWAGWRWGLPLARQALYLRMQASCMSHLLAPETVVYEEEPAAVASLLARPEYSSTQGIYMSLPLGKQPTAGYLPDLVRKFQAAPPLSDGNGQAIVFLHARRSPSGKLRFVYVNMKGHWNPPDETWAKGHVSRYGPAANVYVPAGWSPGEIAKSRDSQPSPLDDGIYDNGSYSSGLKFRLYAGQADAIDQSHFSIRYDLLEAYQPWASGTIDGYLQDDDTVRFKIRDGPLLPPSVKFQMLEDRKKEQ